MQRCGLCQTQWAQPDDTVCYYDRKLLSGLIALPDPTRLHYRIPSVDRPNIEHHGVSPAQILSDEQLELAQLLEALGAVPDVIRKALARSA